MTSVDCGVTTLHSITARVTTKTGVKGNTIFLSHGKDSDVGRQGRDGVKVREKRKTERKVER